jgi:integrase
MGFGLNLERRDGGVYYFRQTYFVDGKQRSKRTSLKTKSLKVARFLAIQIKSRIDMSSKIPDVSKFEVHFDGNNNIKSVKVDGTEDSIQLMKFIELREVHRAEEHKREIEKLKELERIKRQNELEEREKIKKERELEEFLETEQGQKKLALYKKIHSSIKVKDEENQNISSKSLDDLMKNYIDGLRVGKGTLWKYENLIGKFISYCSNFKITTVDGIDRKLVFSYIQYLKKTEKKQDKTIKNIFATLSTFYNFLITSGETKEQNPFVGHRLEVEEEERQPFTDEELKKIFTSDEFLSNKKLYFICLLLLTTGARPNEICQLWTDDVVKEDDIYTIRITENKERKQTLKTKASKRKIYLNKLLVENGFIEYFDGKKLGMIFDLKKPSTKTYSTFISEDFSKFLRSIGIPEKTMYFFRHTVNNRLKQFGVNSEIRQDLVGHEGQGTNEKIYSKKHSPKNLKDATEEILTYKELGIF